MDFDAIPEPWRTRIILLAAGLYAFSVLLAGLRWALGKLVPTPSNSMRWWLDALDRIAHVIAANSRPLAERIIVPRDGGVPSVLLPRVQLPDERTPRERPSRPGK